MSSANTTLDRIFFALSDSTRRGMLARLAEGNASIGELGAAYAISAPAVTRHVRVLEGAGLLGRQVAGRVHTCSLTSSGLQAAEDWLNCYRRLWESRLGTGEVPLQAETKAGKD